MSDPFAPPLLIAGDGALADVLRDELQRGRRRFRQLDLRTQRPPSPGRSDTLILIGPAAAGPMPSALVDACRQRRLRRLLRIGERALAPVQPDGEATLPIAVETVEVEARAAQLMLRRWPPHLGADPLFGQSPHLLIAGRAAPAQALLMHMLHLAHYSEQPPLITLLSDEPAAWRRAIETDYPQVGQVGRLRYRHLADPALAQTPTVTLGIVCLTDAEQGVALASQLIAQISREQRASPPVLVEIGAGRASGGIGDWDGQLIPFSHRRLALAPAGLLDGHGDALAQVIHEHYRDTTEAQGRDPNAGPAGQPWALLGGAYRDANRHQADHLWIKLAITDCRAVREEQVESFAFTPAEVERLAVVEHLRWAADRWLAGWTYAPVRDNAAKHHPQLIPFAELSGPMQDLDRFAVRLLPTLLARLGLGLQRMLIVAVEPAPDADPPAPRLIRRLLERLLARYPDRTPAIATALSGPAERRIARMALEQADALLLTLCPRPLAETLAAQTNAEQRRDLLDLIASSKRRIALAQRGALAHWLDERAEIRIRLAAGAPEPSIERKLVHIDSAAGTLHWGFEY